MLIELVFWSGGRADLQTKWRNGGCLADKVAAACEMRENRPWRRWRPRARTSLLSGCMMREDTAFKQPSSSISWSFFTFFAASSYSSSPSSTTAIFEQKFFKKWKLSKNFVLFLFFMGQGGGRPGSPGKCHVFSIGGVNFCLREWD